MIFDFIYRFPAGYNMADDIPPLYPEVAEVITPSPPDEPEPEPEQSATAVTEDDIQSPTKKFPPSRPKRQTAATAAAKAHIPESQMKQLVDKLR